MITHSDASAANTLLTD